MVACGSGGADDASGTSAISIDDDDGMESMKWSPDGQHLAVHVLNGKPFGGAVLLVEESRLTQLTSPDVDVQSFSWMPDSQHVVVAQSPNVEGGRSSSQLAIVNLDGSESGRIEPDPALRLWYGISVDPTGSRIVAAAGPKGAPDRIFEPQLWTVDLQTGEAAMLEVDLDGTPDSPEFDVTGDVVTMVRTPRLTGGYGDDHLATVDLDTLAVKRITPTKDNVAKFSLRPCTHSVIYTSVGPFQGGGIQPVFERRIDIPSDSHRIADLEAGFLAVAAVGTDLSYTTYSPGQNGPDVHIRLHELGPCAGR